MRKKSHFLVGRVYIGECFLILIIGIIMIGIVILGLNKNEIKKEIIKEDRLPKISIILNGTTLREIHDNGKDVKYPDNEVILNDGWIINTWQNVEIKGVG